MTFPRENKKSLAEVPRAQLDILHRKLLVITHVPLVRLRKADSCVISRRIGCVKVHIARDQRPFVGELKFNVLGRRRREEYSRGTFSIRYRTISFSFPTEK